MNRQFMVCNFFYYIITAFIILPTSGYAYRQNRFSEAVDHIREPLVLFISVLHNVCWIIGGAFAIGAVARYFQYRQNPGQTPLHQPITLGLLGLALILLPFLAQYALTYPHLIIFPSFLTR